MLISDLQSFADEVERLATLIGAPPMYLPTYGRSEDFARPHIEFDGSRFHYVVVERGRELQRQSSTDPQEILFHVFEGVTFSMACAWELRHRRGGEDTRRLLFETQLAMLEHLSPAWQDRTRKRLDEVLQKHPYTLGR